jgi:hypothetical protein
MILCGRAGFEFDFMYDEEKEKSELRKTGIKMKMESETGYEPSLLLYMERVQELGVKMHGVPDRKILCHVFKDRADILDGRSFEAPSFETFLPHINFLNLFGEHKGIDDGTSAKLIPPSGKSQWEYEQEQRTIWEEKAKALFEYHISTKSTDGRKRMIELLNKCWGSTSWAEIFQKLPLEKVKTGYIGLEIELGAVGTVPGAGGSPTPPPAGQAAGAPAGPGKPQPELGGIDLSKFTAMEGEEATGYLQAIKTARSKAELQRIGASIRERQKQVDVFPLPDAVIDHLMVAIDLQSGSLTAKKVGVE